MTEVLSVQTITTKDNNYKWEYRWFNIIALSLLTPFSVYGAILLPQANLGPFLYSCAIVYICGLSVTAGAHRLWAHRSYKAKLPLQLFLAFFDTAAMVGSIYNWARDHRVHHRHTETDADPHNAKRGLFFSHVGWLFYSKHPRVVEAGKKINLKDITDDPVVMFQKKYYTILSVSLVLILHIAIPMIVWNESFKICFFVHLCFRYFLFLNTIWSVNSFAHLFGDHPYSNKISPAENVWVSIFTMGEGYHNYHHTFPWDYATSELNYIFNGTAKFIKLMESVGLAYDLKKATPQQISMRKAKTLADNDYNESSLLH